MRAFAPLVAVFVGLSSGAAAQDEDEAWPDYREIREHLIVPAPVVPTEWREGAPNLVLQSYPLGWDVLISVDETGAVSRAEIQSGPPEHRDDAIVAARAMRFAPFERDGRATSVTFPYPVSARPADYVGPSERAFPDNIDLDDVRIRLQRTGCLGTCPGYMIEITGDGGVTYFGEGFVLIEGEHRGRIPHANVEAILALLRRADYFRLEGYYEINATDLPTYFTGLEIGGQRKFVLNYGGSGMGETAASTVMGPNEGPAMPPVVTEIEEIIDRLSGAEAYVRGNEHTMAALRAEAFDFRSESAGWALGHAIATCNLPLAHALLDEGAPIVTTYPHKRERTPVVTWAPSCGDMALVAALIERGALRRRETAEEFLRAASDTGFPDMVRLALRYSRAVNARGEREYSPLMGAAQAMDPREFERDPLPAAPFDRAEAVDLLLRAGANPRFHDELMGWTPLHVADDAAVARLLLAAGADPNARDRSGQTPLFHTYDGEIVRALIAGGADVRIRDGGGRTALFDAGSADVVSALVEAGLDPNEPDLHGATALETANGAEIALAMIRLGATLPRDPARLTAVLERARRGEWTSLLPLLEQHARELGVVETNQ